MGQKPDSHLLIRLPDFSAWVLSLGPRGSGAPAPARGGSLAAASPDAESGSEIKQQGTLVSG